MITAADAIEPDVLWTPSTRSPRRWVYQRLGCSPCGVIVELGGPEPVHIASGVRPCDAESILSAMNVANRTNSNGGA